MPYEENAGAKMRREIGDYASARRAARELKNGRLGNNTWIFERPDGEGGVDVVIILHNTPIVTYHEDDSVTLNSGGYQTVTTKARMNEVAPPWVRVSQHKRVWSVSAGVFRGKFFDGIRLYPKGEPFGHRRGDDYEENAARIIHRVGKGRNGPLVKVYWDSEQQEYEVLHERGKHGEGYFTTDKQDAIDTAEAMAKEGRNPPSSRKLHLGPNKVLVTPKVWRAALEEGRAREFPSYSSLGGYPLYYVVAEQGERGFWKNHATVLASTINSDQLGGEDVVIDVEINYEDDDLTDDITGEKIPAAYTDNARGRELPES